MANIEIYTTAICPYCVNAKRVLTNMGQEFKEIRVDKSPEQWDIMLKRSNGARTVPQIFINDFHVGGFDDMMALKVEGKLEPLLAK